MDIQQNQQIEIDVANSSSKNPSISMIILRIVAVGLYYFLPPRFTSVGDLFFAMFLVSWIIYSWHPDASTTRSQSIKIWTMAFAIVGYRYFSAPFAISAMPSLVVILQMLKYLAAILAIIGPFWGDKPYETRFPSLSKSWPVIRFIAVVSLLLFEVIAFSLMASHS